MTSHKFVLSVKVTIFHLQIPSSVTSSTSIRHFLYLQLYLRPSLSSYTKRFSLPIPLTQQIFATSSPSLFFSSLPTSSIQFWSLSIHSIFFFEKQLFLKLELNYCFPPISGRGWLYQSIKQVYFEMNFNGFLFACRLCCKTIGSWKAM